MSDDNSKFGDYPEGATPLDPDELAGLRFKHVSTRGELRAKLCGYRYYQGATKNLKPV